MRNVIVPIVVLTPELSASRASSSARRLPPARPEEVRRPRPRPPEPGPHVGGDSGAAGRRATGSGSAPPRRVCRASEVSFHHSLLALCPAPVLRTSAACLLMFFLSLSAQARYSSHGGNMAEEFQKNCKFTFLNNVSHQEVLPGPLQTYHSKRHN